MDDLLEAVALQTVAKLQLLADVRLPCAGAAWLRHGRLKAQTRALFGNAGRIGEVGDTAGYWIQCVVPILLCEYTR